MLEDIAKTIGFCMLVTTQLRSDRRKDVKTSLAIGSIDEAIAPYLEQQKLHYESFRNYEFHQPKVRRSRNAEAASLRWQLQLLKKVNNQVMREFAKTIGAIRRAYRNQSQK
jgi:hypothetical protein